MYALADSNQSKTILQTNGSQVYRSLPITTAITLDLHQYTSSLLRIIICFLLWTLTRYPNVLKNVHDLRKKYFVLMILGQSV